MKTRLSPENPYGFTRCGYAWENIPAGSAAHLDVGCHDGAFLASLRSKGISRLAGVDVARGPIDRARRQFPDLEFQHVAEDRPLPFADGTFSSATLLDVIEHVYDQARLLSEVNRVLLPGGRLIITVPRRYLFSFLDLGNLKFVFPRLHRTFYCLTHSRSDYDQRYVHNPDGLVGDVSARKRRHEHFSQDALAALLARSGFEPESFDGSGFFARPLSPATKLGMLVPGLRGMMRAISRTDARRFESMNLFCTARKDRPAVSAS